MPETKITLADVIAQLESGGRDSAIRFEAAAYARWLTETSRDAAEEEVIRQVRNLNHCSTDTARMIACTSWGRYQILGMNLYSRACGWQGTIVDYVTAPDLQRACFDNFLRHRVIAYTLEEVRTDRVLRERFIVRYNGPANIPGYWAAMQRAMTHLGLPPVTADTNLTL